MGKEFPNDFIWGVSTASYQIEGGWNEGGRGESIWDRYAHIPGNILHGDTGDLACDCYHKAADDLELMKQLHLPAYRFSISWSRIFPDGYGKISQDGIRYYEELISGLLKNGIEPYVTLFHWDLPQKLQDEGGWANRLTAEHFAEYCGLLFQIFGDRVHHWITLNEPWVVSFGAFYENAFAPGGNDFSMAMAVAHGQLLGHGLAVKKFREMGLSGEIGIALSLSPKAPLTEKEEDYRAAVRLDGYMNRWFLDPIFTGSYPADMLELYEKRGCIMPDIRKGDMELISAPLDFLGINYYNIDFAEDDPGRWPIGVRTGFANGNPMTHYQMPITPDGIRQIIVRCWKDYHPAKILISENGASYQDHPDHRGEIPDEQRIDYLYRHIAKIGEALEEGAPVKGYFVWSLFDNFEWKTGFENQFGLVYIDRATRARIPKKSYYWYHDVIRENGRNLSDEKTR